MNTKLKTIFIGGLSNGFIVYDYLKKNIHVDLQLAITYKNDFRGARNKALPDDDIIVRSGTVEGYHDKISQIQPDLIVVAGWSELIPDNLLHIAPMGCIGFHPAKLPMDRGRSVLAWQIEDGYTETALTMFRYTDFPDGGDILAQEPIRINHTDYINDVLDKVDNATFNMMRSYFPLLRKGLLQAHPQDLTTGSFRRLRGDKDSTIDWNHDSRDIYNKIRAISHPYPGATTMLDGQKILVWRALECNDFPLGKEQNAGTLVATLYDNSLVFRSRDGFIRITEWEVS